MPSTSPTKRFRTVIPPISSKGGVLPSQKKVDGPPRPQGSPAMYALFVICPSLNYTTFVMTHSNKMTLINHSIDSFLPNMWFAIYRLDTTVFLFGSRIKATRWDLDTKFAGKTATETFANVTPMQTAYRIDDGEWYFKTF